jgi:hypothetical protein
LSGEDDAPLKDENMFDALVAICFNVGEAFWLTVFFDEFDCIWPSLEKRPEF